MLKHLLLLQPLEELLLLPLLLEREIFKHLLLHPLPEEPHLLQLPPQLLPLLNFLSSKRPLTLSLLETNKVIVFLETTSPPNSVIKPNNLNFLLKKLNLHKSCNKEYN